MVKVPTNLTNSLKDLIESIENEDNQQKDLFIGDGLQIDV